MSKDPNIPDLAKKAMTTIQLLFREDLGLEYPKHYVFTAPLTFFKDEDGKELRAIGIHPKDIETMTILIAIDDKILRKAFPNLLNFGFKTSYGYPSKNFYIRFKENWRTGKRKTSTRQIENSHERKP